jgi:hypothetical protein
MVISCRPNSKADSVFQTSNAKGVPIPPQSAALIGRGLVDWPEPKEASRAEFQP